MTTLELTLSKISEKKQGSTRMANPPIPLPIRFNAFDCPANRKNQYQINQEDSRNKDVDFEIVADIECYKPDRHSD